MEDTVHTGNSSETYEPQLGVSEFKRTAPTTASMDLILSINAALEDILNKTPEVWNQLNEQPAALLNAQKLLIEQIKEQEKKLKDLAEELAHSQANNAVAQRQLATVEVNHEQAQHRAEQQDNIISTLKKGLEDLEKHCDYIGSETQKEQKAAEDAREAAIQATKRVDEQQVEIESLIKMLVLEQNSSKNAHITTRELVGQIKELNQEVEHLTDRLDESLQHCETHHQDKSKSDLAEQRVENSRRRMVGMRGLLQSGHEARQELADQVQFLTKELARERRLPARTLAAELEGVNLRGTYIDDLGRKDADCDRVVSDAGFGDADRGLTDSGSVADFDNWDLYEDPSSVRHHGRIKSSSVPSFAQNTSSTVAELGPKNDSSATDSDNLGISSTGPSSATDPHNSTLDQTNSSSVTSVGQNNLTGATGLGQNNSSTAGSDNSNIKHANPSSATDLSQSKLRSATAPHEEDTASLDHAQPDPKIPIDLPAIITANSDLPTLVSSPLQPRKISLSLFSRIIPRRPPTPS